MSLENVGRTLITIAIVTVLVCLASTTALAQTTLSGEVLAPSDSSNYDFPILTADMNVNGATVTATATWASDWYLPPPTQYTQSVPNLVEVPYLGGSGCDFLYNYPQNHFVTLSLDRTNSNSTTTTSITVGPGKAVAIAGSDCFFGDNFTFHELVTWNVQLQGCHVDLSNVRFFTSTFGFRPVMAATFVPPNGLTLADHASNCGFKAFDWQQKITVAPCPSAIYANDPAAAPMCPDGSVGSVSATLPFNDPPQGGYRNPPGDPYPFYYPFTRAISEEQSPTGACILRTVLGCIPLVSTDGKTLAFFDAPADPCLGILSHIYCTSSAPPGSFVGFITSLVGIKQDDTPSDPLFHWSWTDTFNGLSGGIATTFNDQPPDPGSGIGNVTITDINGVPQTPPTVTCAATPSILWPPNGKPVVVTVSGTIKPGTQAIPFGGTTYAVIDEYSQVQPTGTIAVSAGGSYSFTLSLIAARNGSDIDGRTYSINVIATDAIGNVGSCAAVLTVPHDQGQ